uniref:hypothetical protein n=1 Tax=Thaumasiovibrio occultus TaxID=1891184 RepID=UPI000B35F9F0|nr:hypothetical protein [Thaumasiovibrio occultus]
MQFWQTSKEKFSALSSREKGIIFATGTLLILYLGALQFLEPKWNELQFTRQEISRVEGQINTQQQQITLTQALLQIDPDKEIDQRITALEQRVELLDESMQDKVGHLVTPSLMAQVIEQAFSQAKNVQLLKFQSLPARRLVSEEAMTEEALAKEASAAEEKDVAQSDAATAPFSSSAPAALQGGGYFVHPFEIQLEGRYVDIYHYLQALEQLPVVFYWESFHYQVAEYPKAHVRLVVYTLGPREVFISG